MRRPWVAMCGRSCSCDHPQDDVGAAVLGMLPKMADLCFLLGFILPDDDPHPTLGFIHGAAASLQLQDSVVRPSFHRFTCAASSFVSRSWISVASTARV